jgi:NAD-dependent deacetylase
LKRCDTNSAVIAEVRSWLQSAKRPCALTGAGISAESGIPTFRGAGGLWRQFRAQDLATPQAFDRDPKLVWEWYDWRRGPVAAAKPNPGHIALARHGMPILTQNVDGLHRRAGSTQVIEIHGSLWTLRCLHCGREERNETTPLPELPPRCTCGGLLRPAVVWFGEGLDGSVWRAAEDTVRGCDLLFVIGTSAVVYPAASLAPLARESGARIVEINPDETPLSGMADAQFRAASGEILPLLIE